MEDNPGLIDIPSSNGDEVAKTATSIIEENRKAFEKFKESNPDIEPNNLKIFLKFLNKLMNAANSINELSPADRESFYYVLYSATIVMHDV
jgi:hypothetical protein